MSGCKRLWCFIIITFLINLTDMSLAGIRFVDDPSLVQNEKNWKLLIVQFKVDKDWGDPRTERKRPFKWEVELYDSQNNRIDKKLGAPPNLKNKNNEIEVELQVPKIGKYQVIVKIGYDDGRDCDRGKCVRIHEFDPFNLRRYPPKIFAVIIGIDRYKDDDLSNLHFPDDDADSIEHFLIDVLEVPRKQIKKLTSEKASRSNIRDAIRAIRKQIKSEDILIVYYSGHGILHQNYFFFAPYDTIQESDSDWFNDDAYISLDQWDRWLKTHAKYLILIQDSCFSGYLLNTDMKDIWKKYWNEDFATESRHAILASLPTQQAYEVYYGKNGNLRLATRTYPNVDNKEIKGHGLFTYALLHAIEQIVAEEKISVDLNHDSKCGETPCSKPEKNVSSKVKENSIKISLANVYVKLADFMREFTKKHGEEMQQRGQQPIYYPMGLSGDSPTLMHHELLDKGH